MTFILRFFWNLKLKLKRSSYRIWLGTVPMGDITTNTTEMPISVGKVHLYPPGRDTTIKVTGPCRHLMRVSVNGVSLPL